MATILIVDDRGSNREYLVTLLGYQGHQLIEAQDGAQALHAAYEARPDLIITDIVMPTMDGYELARRIRAAPELAHTRIIFVTASYLRDETLVLAQACGVNHLIIKPAEPQEILEMVSTALQAEPAPPLEPVDDSFYQAHLRLLTDTLAKKVDALEAEMEERERAQALLRLHSAALNAAGNAIAITDHAGSIQWVNAAFESLTGYSAHEALGQNMRLLKSGHQDEGYYQALWAAISSGQTWEGEVVNRRKDGSVYIQDQTITPVRDARGHISHFVSIQQDISARKQAERVLAQTTDMLLRAEQIGLIGSWRWNIPNDDVTLSDGMYHVLGLPRNAFGATADAYLEMVHADDQARVRQAVEITLRERGVLDFEARFVRFDGEVRHIYTRAEVLPDDQGNPANVVGIGMDVTERVMREREMQAIATVSTALRTTNTQAEMVAVVLDHAAALLDASGCALAVRNESGEGLAVVLGRGDMAGLAGKRLLAGEGAVGVVTRTGQPYLSADAGHDTAAQDEAFANLGWASGARALAAVPLLTGTHVMGVILAARAVPFVPAEARVFSAIADIAASALKRASLHEQTKQRLGRLLALRNIDLAIMNSLDINLTLGVLLGQTLEQLGAAAAAVLGLERGAQLLEFVAGRGFRSAAIERTRLRLGEDFAGQAALHRRLVAVPDLSAQADAFRRASLLNAEGFGALFCAPLIAKGEVLGVLEVFLRAPFNPDPDWRDFLETLAGQAAIAVADARLFGDLQRSNAELLVAYDTTLLGWTATLDLRDHATEGHSRRVTELTLQLARQLGVGDAQLEHVRRGALLHDIGKMAIPDTILLKPGPLTDEEWTVMRQHPQHAYQLLSPITFLRPALDIPYCHHEKWDGSGYPRGLQGEAIPLAARIFAVMDVWDALRSDRPYRSAWPLAKVRQYLRDQAGQHFDPAVVEAFLAMEMQL